MAHSSRIIFAALILCVAIGCQRERLSEKYAEASREAFAALKLQREYVTKLKTDYSAQQLRSSAAMSKVTELRRTTADWQLENLLGAYSSQIGVARAYWDKTTSENRDQQFWESFNRKLSSCEAAIFLRLDDGPGPRDSTDERRCYAKFHVPIKLW